MIPHRWWWMPSSSWTDLSRKSKQGTQSFRMMLMMVFSYWWKSMSINLHRESWKEKKKMIPMSAWKTDASLYEREDRCICLYPGTNIACTLFLFIKALGYGQGSEYYSVPVNTLPNMCVFLNLCNGIAVSVCCVIPTFFPWVKASWILPSLS